MKSLILFLFLICATLATAQKQLILEKTNDPVTTRFQIGERLIFRLEGEENYWYERTITDIYPDGNSLLLDGYLVKVSDIAAIKIYRNRGWRIVGGALLSFGITLGIATVSAAAYQDWDQNYPLLIGTTAASTWLGTKLLRRKKVKMGNTYRLRIIEIVFEAPDPVKS